MKHLILFFTLLAATPCLRAEAVVSNVWAAQIPGTHQVRIEYDLTALVPCDIQVQFSLNAGATYGPSIADAVIPLDMRKNVTAGNRAAGTQKSITLPVAELVNGVPTVKISELNNQFTKNLRFKVLATESTGPIIIGDMVRIDGGSFQMGDQSNPLVGYSWELPVHTVQVSTFYMGRYEVSWGLWKQVRDWARASGLGYTDLLDGAGKADDHPVHSISWFAMVKWCNARTEYENATLGRSATPCYTVNGLVYRTGSSAPVCNFATNGYRLPTEAEWEKAARGGQPGYNFPWGNTIGHSKANYYSYTYSYEDEPKNQGYHPDYTAGGTPYTAPVNSFAPNGYGLYNMAGNVWEWCWDLYLSNYYSDPTAGDNPHGPTSSSLRVLRGGSWGGHAFYCRVADRFFDFPANSYYYGPANGYNSVGFRPARSSVP